MDKEKERLRKARWRKENPEARDRERKSQVKYMTKWRKENPDKARERNRIYKAKWRRKQCQT